MGAVDFGRAGLLRVLVCLLGVAAAGLGLLMGWRNRRPLCVGAVRAFKPSVHWHGSDDMRLGLYVLL